MSHFAYMILTWKKKYKVIQWMFNAKTARELSSWPESKRDLGVLVSDCVLQTHLTWLYSFANTGFLTVLSASRNVTVYPAVLIEAEQSFGGLVNLSATDRQSKDFLHHGDELMEGWIPNGHVCSRSEGAEASTLFAGREPVERKEPPSPSYKDYFRSSGITLIELWGNWQGSSVIDLMRK